MSCRRAFLVALLALAAAPGSTHAHYAPSDAPVVRAAGAPDACPGDPIAADHVVTGEFGTELAGSYVLVPFAVPAGTTAVRVKYCHDQPEAPTNAQVRHTLDLGIYDARSEPGTLHGEAEFRGWGGSSHPDVTISPEGFSSEEEYRKAPRAHVPGKTTRGFRPGPLPAGEWAAELGVAGVASQLEGDADGKVAWRVEVELSRDPAFADEPYAPVPYDSRPARAEAGWYAGDMHVHAEHSSLGDATMTETFDYAFRPEADGGAGLDFVTLSDYVTDTAWGEVGRHQPDHPGKLIARSAEIITYRGHANNHVSARYVDYRTGPVYERLPDGALVERRGARPASELFDAVHNRGGFTQVNHPTIFPSEFAVFALLCRGCPWDYTDAETDWSRVDAYEVHTGPPGTPEPDGNELGPNPFTATAIDEYDRLRRAGHRPAAVAVSDSHHAGRVNNPVTQSPVGTGMTVVYADELSEGGLEAAVRAGHTYARVFGPASPDLRLEARNDNGTAIMGDPLPGDGAGFTARVIGGVASASPRTLIVLRDGSPVASVPVTSADFTHAFRADRKGDWRIQVMRGSAVDALTTPISLGAARPAAAAAPAFALRLGAAPRRVTAGRRTRFRFRVTYAGAPVQGAVVRFARRRVTTNRRGRAAITTRLRRGRHRARATHAGHRAASVTITASRRSTRARRRARFTG